MANNPYAPAGPFSPPSSALSNAPAVVSGVTLPTPAMLASDASSRAWITTLAVLAFVVAAMTGLAAVATTIVMRNARPITLATVAPPLAYLFITTTLALVGLRLAEYARALRELGVRPGIVAFEAASQRARSLWTAAGVVALAWTLCVLVGGVLAVRAAFSPVAATAVGDPVDAPEAH